MSKKIILDNGTEFKTKSECIKYFSGIIQRNTNYKIRKDEIDNIKSMLRRHNQFTVDEIDKISKIFIGYSEKGSRSNKVKQLFVKINNKIYSVSMIQCLNVDVKHKKQIINNDSTLEFGKYKYCYPVYYIIHKDKKYIEWCMKNIDTIEWNIDLNNNGYDELIKKHGDDKYFDYFKKNKIIN